MKQHLIAPSMHQIARAINPLYPINPGIIGRIELIIIIRQNPDAMIGIMRLPGIWYDLGVFSSIGCSFNTEIQAIVHAITNPIEDNRQIISKTPAPKNGPANIMMVHSPKAAYGVPYL